MEDDSTAALAHRLDRAERGLYLAGALTLAGLFVAVFGSLLLGWISPLTRPEAVRVLAWPQAQQRGAGHFARAPASDPAIAEGFGPGLELWTRPAWRALSPPPPPEAR